MEIENELDGPATPFRSSGDTFIAIISEQLNMITNEGRQRVFRRQKKHKKKKDHPRPRELFSEHDFTH